MHRSALPHTANGHNNDAPVHVPELLRQLVRTIHPPPSSTTAAAQQSYQQDESWLHSLSIRLAQAGPRWRGREEEGKVVQEAMREIHHRSAHLDQQQGVTAALQFESLYRKWRHLSSTIESNGGTPLVQKRAELIYLLSQLSGQAQEQLNAPVGQLGMQLHANYHQAIVAAPAREQQQQITPYQQQGLTVPATSAPAGPRVRHATQLSEPELLRDILYVLLGQDGNHIKFSPSADAFLLLPGLNIPRPQKLLVQRVCELGWLFAKVQKYVKDVVEGEGIVVPIAMPQQSGSRFLRGGNQPTSVPLIRPEHSGKIEQAFAATLREELNEYMRFITLLETQVEKELRSTPANVQANPSGSLIVPAGASSSAQSQQQQQQQPQHNAAQFTLKRLLVFVQEAFQTLSLLAQLVEAVRGVKGACLASVIGLHLRHGDPAVGRVVRRVMMKTCVPLFLMLDSWLSSGWLQDPYSEFFISSNVHIPFEKTWAERFSLRRSMIPSFFTSDLVEKILGIGKAVNFIREVCKEAKYTLKVKVEYKLMFSSGSDLTSFTHSINEAFNTVHTHLLSLLITRYHFLDHAFGLKQYLLLSAGDFAGNLLEFIGSELERPARDISNAHLLGILESAKRASSFKSFASTVGESTASGTATGAENEILNRLSVSRIVPHKDEVGWDLFRLEYLFEADSPLRMIFSEKLLGTYSELFYFSFQLKHVESRLNESWVIQTKLGHSHQLRKLGLQLGGGQSNELEPFLRNVSGLRNEMSHFISNLHSYVMFEVIEVAWEGFVRTVKGESAANAQVNSATTQQQPSQIKSAWSTLPNTPVGTTVTFFEKGFDQQRVASTTGNVSSSIAQPASSLPSQPQSQSTKPLDLDGLIAAHKSFLQQIVDKVLMGGSSGTLHPQLLTLFHLLLSFTSFHARLYTFLSAELTRRTELDRAAAKSSEQGKWNLHAGTKAEDAKRNFVVELSASVREFSVLNHRFHTCLLTYQRSLKEANRAAVESLKRRSTREDEAGDDGAEEDELDEESVAPVSASKMRSRDMLGSPAPAQELKARRKALHLHSLDFLRFRLDFNEFYAFNKKAHQEIIAAYERAAEKVRGSKAVVPASGSLRPSIASSARSSAQR